MYNVSDICRYVINYSNKMGYGISNLKLQKVLYFIQAYFLINAPDRSPCFNEEIEAWDFGPVVPVAYHEYKQYGGGQIPSVDSYLVFDIKDIWNCKRVAYDENIISEEDRKLINEAVNKLSAYSATDLVRLTHKQTPWKIAYKPNSNNTITIDSMRDYFNGK